MSGRINRIEPEGVLRHILASDPRDEAVFLKRCAEVSDWPRLIAEAERHAVVGILDQKLSAAMYPLPQRDHGELKQRAAVQRLVQRHYGEVSDEILTALDGAGVPTLPLKGPVLGERLYGDPTLRVAWDLDIMVALRDVPAAQAVLDGLGYRSEPAPSGRNRSGHHIKAVRDGSPLVELHYRLTSNFGMILPSEDFLARSVHYRTARGVSCLVLSAEDELLYLVLHAAEHIFARVAWLLDVKALVAAHPGLDWVVIADRARMYRVERAYRFATELIARRMEIMIPPGATRPRSPDARAVVAGALFSLSELSKGSASGKILGHLLRATLADELFTGARYLRQQLPRARWLLSK